MSENLSIIYYKNKSIEDELEIEEFWLDIKRSVYAITEDVSLISFTETRRHQPAVIGAYAGILIDIILKGIPVVYTYYEIWKTITDHLSKKRMEGKVIRIKSLGTLENICRYDLTVNKEVEGADLTFSRILYEKYKKSFDDHEFWFEGPVQTELAAEIVFEKKKYKFVYLIRTDGEIESYEKRKK